MKLVIVGAYLVYSSYYGGGIDHARIGISNSTIKFESQDECLVEATKLNEEVLTGKNGAGRYIVVYDCLPILMPSD